LCNKEQLQSLDEERKTEQEERKDAQR